MESTGSARMNCRRRPLQSCEGSALAIVHKSCLKAQELNEPLGSMAKRAVTLGSLVSSFVYSLQHIWLAILTCFDDCILALEDVVERVFPPSKHVFDKVDEVVLIIETLPGKFDDVLDKFPVIMEQVPLLDWAIGQAISWLKSLTFMLTQWVSGNAKEKEIVVDMGCTERNGESAAAIVEPNVGPSNNEESFPPVSKKLKTTHESEMGGGKFKPCAGKGTYKEVTEKPKTSHESEILGGEKAKPSSGKGTYKEVLERGKRENIEKNKTEKDAKKDENPKVEEAGYEESERDGTELKNDSILELFDSGWVMKHPAKNAVESSLQRSVSYT